LKQPNGCSTPAAKSSATKQWIKEELAQTKEAFCERPIALQRQQP